MPSLPQNSPTGGLGTGFPLVRGPPTVHSDLMSFYVTTYEVAFGRREPGASQKSEWRVLGVKPPDQAAVHPLLGLHSGSGYVTNNYSAASSLVTPRPQPQHPFVSISTTAGDFKLFGHPQFQRILPQAVDEPECGYPQEFSLSWLLYEAVNPPKATKECSTWTGCVSIPQPGTAQGTAESSCLPGSSQRTDLVPLEHPPGIVAVDPCCSENRHGLPVLGHPFQFAPLELRVGPRDAGKKDPLRYSTTHHQYLSNTSTLAPVAPAWWSQGPIWAPRSVDGVQAPCPSGFSTNNLPTALWHNDDPPMWPPKSRESRPWLFWEAPKSP